MAQAQIKVRLDKSEAQSDASELRESLIGSLTPVIDVGNIAGRVWDVFVSGLRESVGAAIEAEVAEQRLTSALRQRGLETEDVTRRMSAYNAAVGLAIGIADEELLRIQSTLVARGANTDSLELATKATIGLAEVTGKDLESATQIVSRVLDGNTKILERYQIHTKSASEALEILAGKSALVAERGELTQGRIERLTNALGELAETVGNVVLAKGADGKGWLDDLADNARHAIVGIDELVTTFDSKFDLQVVQSELATRGLLLSLKDGTAELIRMGEEAENTARGLAKLEEARAAKAITDAAASAANLDKMQLLLAGIRGGQVADFGDGGTEIVGRSRAQIARDEAEAKRVADERQRAADEERRWRETQLEAENAAWNTSEDQKRAHEQRLTEIELDAEDQRRANRLNAEAEAADAERAWQDRQEAARAQFAEGGIRMATSFAASMGAMLGAAAANGEDASEALKRAAGMGIAMIGQMIVELGTAAITAGVLGTAVPLLGIVTGGPGAIAAGAAAVVAGAGIIAAGTALGAKSPSSRSARTPALSSARASRTEATSDPFGFLGAGSGEKTNVFNVNFNGGIFGGDPRRLGRELRDLIMDGGSLVPEGGR